MELCLELSLSSFCAVYIVLLRQYYVAMPSGYKLVITRALGMHGIYCTQPSGLSPRASVQYIPYIPRARVITITYCTPGSIIAHLLLHTRKWFLFGIKRFQQWENKKNIVYTLIIMHCNVYQSLFLFSDALYHFCALFAVKLRVRR